MSTTEQGLTMPSPPKGYVWVLRVFVEHDYGALELRKLSWWSKTHIDSWASRKAFALLAVPGDLYKVHLNVHKASIDTIEEATVAAAYEITKELAEQPVRRKELQDRANELSERLGIRVDVE